MRTGIVSFIAGASILLTAPAAAGGGNWIDFEEDYNVAGSEVTINAAFSTRDEDLTRAHAPYYVYLEQVIGPQYGWGMPDVDDPDVYRVGEVEILWPEDGHEFTDGLPNNPHLTATFELPPVPLGKYLMSICDHECKHSPGGRWGNVDPTGFFWVVESAGEADAREEIDRLQTRLAMFRAREQRDDQNAYKQFARDLQQQERGEQRLVNDLRVVRRDLRTAVADANDLRGERNLAWAGLALVLTLGVAISGAAWRSRRRARSLEHSGFRGPGSGNPAPVAASISSSTSRRWRPWSPSSSRRPVPRRIRPGSSPGTTEQPPARSRD